MRSNLSGLHLFKSSSIISVLDRFLMILICGVLLWGNLFQKPFRIEWFVYAQTAAYAITAIIALLFVVRKARYFYLRWDVAFNVEILRKSFPFAILILLMTFYNRIDSVMLERMLPDGKVQAGIYAQGYRLLDAANMIAFLFATLLLPIFSRMIRRGEGVGHLVGTSLSLIIIPAVITAAASWAFPYQFMELLYEEHTSVSAPVFAWLMLCFVATSTTYIFGTLLTANGNLRELNLMATGGLVFNILLNILFIPLWKSLGAAMASVITQFLMAGAQVWIVQHIFRFGINTGLTIRIIGFTVATEIIWLGATLLSWHWLACAGIAVVASVLGAFLLKLIPSLNLFQRITEREYDIQ